VGGTDQALPQSPSL